ncbi:MAG: SH3 domain-containing protein [Clostridia bacterium]|nr:SH3 domain-containing protein [Clostridia bacterium]
MRKMLLIALLLCLAAFPALADAYTDLEPGIVSVVAPQPIPLRAEPIYSAEPTTYIASGMRLTLLDVSQETGWGYVRMDNTAEPYAQYGHVRLGALRNGDYLSNDMLRVINTSPGERLNLREKPTAESPSLGKYFTGTLVVNYDSVYHPQGEGYLRVKVGNQIGYMAKEYLAPSDSSSDSMLPTTTISSSGGTGGNLRGYPSLDGQLLDFYPNGTKVTILGVAHDGWCHVMVAGKTGFMRTELLKGQISFDSHTPMIAMDNNPCLFSLPNDEWQIISWVGGAPTAYVYGKLADGWAYVCLEGQWGYMRLDSLTTDLNYVTTESGAG